jgi:type I restriction-modification system DNA methylase subunit
LFVKILGYTLNPVNDYNLTTELKNVKDSKKADGGIIVKNKVRGVIELKGTNTTDLSKIETQAFGYKNNQSGCTYVITSNFEKLRFYIDNAIEYQAFNLFELNETEFSLLYLCLAYDNISRDLPKKIKNDSHNQEEITTKQLYKDYSLFKRELFNNLVELNPTHEPLLLFKKSQKLLDRFLFLFFAEDRHLLPPNSVRLILKQWKQLREMDAYTPLYKRFKKYFGYLNTGHKGKQYDVYPYNGGLFRPDGVLDKISIITNCFINTLKLSEYDFASEVDVNILGHIFENSLNEIEEVQTQLEENPTEVKLSKRKKDGVFYTPKYITKYIVENTIGKLCEEKKIEANLVEEDYNINRQNKTKKALLEKLNTYREWLLQLTVVDPACGSGAFLNEALNYLIAEHWYLDELETKLMGGGLVFPNVENSILENNLFGVDINNESVEIAKLSLWLRTAQPNRKLNDLSGNIKCGNSLIDDPEVAGDKAFNWEKEFPQVFAKGGFDVVIGNPPYLRKQGLIESYPEMCDFYENKYQSATSNYDIYALFIERSFDFINKTGIVSYILPHKFLVTDFGVGIRQFFMGKLAVESILHFGSEMVFADASTYTCIINLDKSKKDKVHFKKVTPIEINNPFDWDYILYENLSNNNWDL